MAEFLKRGKNWYFRFVDGDGVRRMRRGCPCKRATEELARAAETEAARIRAGLIDPKAEAYRRHESRPLADHLDDYKAALVAKGGTAKHAGMSTNRARRVLSLAGIERISDLSLSKALGALAALRSEGLGPETINHHVRAVKAFSRWLWRDGRAREHALAHLGTINPETDRRRVRRALIPEEAARLIRAAESGRDVLGMTGPDRAILYSMALATGFRASELASLVPESFRLAESPPLIVCEAAYAKNGRRAEQPIPESLAARLSPWLATRPAGQTVFELTDRTAEMIRVDLESAGIPYETASGVIDFHALRHTYGSMIVRSGCSVKTAQELLRHSTPTLTIGRYAHASLHDIKGAVGALPDLTPDPSAPEAPALAATGTEGAYQHPPFDPYLIHTREGSGRIATAIDGRDDVNAGSDASMSMDRNPLEMEDLDASGRSLTAPESTAGGGSRTHTRVAPKRILSPLRLPRDRYWTDASVTLKS